jgi:hypothetical protein
LVAANGSFSPSAPRHPAPLSDDLLGPRVGLLAIELTNGHAKPFVWTKTADQILDSVARFCPDL